MTHQEREEFAQKLLIKCKNLREIKGSEYSRRELDVNSNFKRISNSLNEEPIKIAFIYMYKHLDAITNFIKNGITEGAEPIEGRLADLINYSIIIASLLEEKRLT